MPRKTVSITVDVELLKALKNLHVNARIRRLRESGSDLPFSYFIEKLIKSGMEKYEKEIAREHQSNKRSTITPQG